MTGIAELFADLNGASAYEMQLELWCWRQRDKKRDLIADWRRRHPETVRGYTRNWRARRSPEMCSQCARPHVPGKKTCTVHLERDRQRAARAYAAKKEAAPI